MIYSVLSLDVWGNAEDGWEVNQVFTTSFEIEVSEDADTREIVAALIDIGYLSPRAKGKVDVECESESEIHLSVFPDGRPLCTLRVK
jgi:hypothetical protein